MKLGTAYWWYVRILVLNIIHFFNTPTKCPLYISTYVLNKSLLLVSVCYTLSWGRTWYTWSQLSCLQGYCIRCVIKYKIYRFCGWTMFLTQLKIIYIARFFLCLRALQKFKILICSTLIQCVPLATEPGISLVILPLMRILQRNLKRTYHIV